MATIKSAIRLNDMMSAPIRNITNAMNMMLSTWDDLDSATSGGLNVEGVESIRSELNQATRALQRMEDEQEDFNEDVRRGAKEMDGLTDKILGAVGAFAGLQGLQQLVNLSDQFTQTTARLNMINDGAQTTEELFDKIYASANRARAPIADMADTVAKLSLNAGDAFSSNDETILFAENLNKLFAIAGTEQASIASASLQLTQALGSGVLRGEEFNAVFEAAPNIMQTVADYMDVPIGQLRSMAAEGQITADIVKNALLSATGEINEQFESMPMTWSQVWTGILNELYYLSLPLLKVINFLANNWSILEPIVLGVAAALLVYLAATKGVELATKAWTAAQTFFNSVMAMNPVFLVIMGVILLISLIYAVVAAYNKWTGSTISATGVIMGAIATAVAFIWNLWVGLIDLTLSVISAIANPWIAFANFFGNLFNDPVAAILNLFRDMADSIFNILSGIARAIDSVFGSNLASAVSGWQSSLGGKIDSAVEKYGNGSYEKVMDTLDLNAESMGLSRWAYKDAYKTGYNFGEGIGESVGEFFGTNTQGGIGSTIPLDSIMGGSGSGSTPTLDDIAKDTSNISNSLDVTSEDLKYLRKVAQMEWKKEFTTASIKVDMTNNNNINNGGDLDGLVTKLSEKLYEELNAVASGVYA
jgi:tape measure domain-containing protein